MTAKKVTRDFLDRVFTDVIIEYSRNRFISEDEFEELKEVFVRVFSEKIIDETIEDQKITLEFNPL